MQEGTYNTYTDVHLIITKNYTLSLASPLCLITHRHISFGSGSIKSRLQNSYEVSPETKWLPKKALDNYQPKTTTLVPSCHYFITAATLQRLAASQGLQQQLLLLWLLGSLRPVINWVILACLFWIWLYSSGK